MFCIEIIAILILILVLYKHSLCPRILEQGLLLFQDKENVLYRTNSNPYSDISSIQTFSYPRILEHGLLLSQDKENFCIELILEQGLLLFQDKKNVLYRNNSNPYSDIISIQTFSLSQNTRIWITIILGQRKCFVQK